MPKLLHALFSWRGGGGGGASTTQSTRKSALSDTKCEAQAKRFISDKARLQVHWQTLARVHWQSYSQNRLCPSRENQSQSVRKPTRNPTTHNTNDTVSSRTTNEFPNKQTKRMAATYPKEKQTNPTQKTMPSMFVVFLQVPHSCIWKIILISTQNQQALAPIILLATVTRT